MSLNYADSIKDTDKDKDTATKRYSNTNNQLTALEASKRNAYAVQFLLVTSHDKSHSGEHEFLMYM